MVLGRWAMARRRLPLAALGRNQHRMNADGSENSSDGVASVDRLALLRAELLARREEMLVARGARCLGCLARTLRVDGQIQSHPTSGGTGSKDAAVAAAGGVVVRPNVLCHRRMRRVVVRMYCEEGRSERALIYPIPIPQKRLSQLTCPLMIAVQKRSCKHV